MDVQHPIGYFPRLGKRGELTSCFRAFHFFGRTEG
jgi:hypothetical protein